jgi:hypothetical protein
LIDDLQTGNIVLRQQVLRIEIIVKGQDVVRDPGIACLQQFAVDLYQRLRIADLLVDLSDQVFRCL